MSLFPSRRTLLPTAAATALWIHAVGAAPASVETMQQQQREVDSSSGTSSIQVFVCQNTAPGAGRDHGCPSHQPICVNAQQQSPAQLQAKGVNCVPCVSHFDTPVEPDWGCSTAQPLCATTTTTSTSTTSKQSQRAETGTAGTHCMDYPCRNSHDVSNNNNHDAGTVAAVDQGCTDEYPLCVDALGNDPPTGRPGVSCVVPSKLRQPRRREQHDTTTQSQKSKVAAAAWGVIETSLKQSSSSSKVRTAAKCLILAGEVEPLPWNKAGQLPLCNGCPFGISKQCEIGAKQHKTLW